MTFKRIRFHVGGPMFHPVAKQASLILDWLGPGYEGELREDAAAFENLDGVDLLVVMGLFWSGSSQMDHIGNSPYRSPSTAQRESFERYVRCGGSLLAHHGGIASYDDWPRFGELLGFAWIWGQTNHSPLGRWQVNVLDTRHPVVSGVDNYEIEDELYYDVKVADDLSPTVHAEAEYQGRHLPMVMTIEGGRVDGAGRSMWLANGHDTRAFASPAMRRLWINSVRWLTETTG